MNVKDVTQALKEIGGYTDDDMIRYKSIIEVNSALVDEDTVKQKDYCKIVYFLAAKTNYELCLMMHNDGVTSFSAGDVKIVQSSADVNRAKELYEMTMKNAADYITDSGFAFLEV